ncbi:MAG: DUF3871 family protein [Flavipsychrobacter sp.]|nr:DUF3871 family protein [Flavipsychrobacter sp.]
MEQQSINNEVKQVGELLPDVINRMEVNTSGRAFIESNTVEGSLYEINNSHLIPVFLRENVPLISQGEFIDTTLQAASQVFTGERILSPSIRLSHPVLGRIPEAKNKPTSELQEHEKTKFYDRLAFLIEIPSISTDVAGNRLNLTVGGVKCYSLENLMSKNYEQHFKVFIGFEVKACTNLCISTDGLMRELKVKNIEALYNGIQFLFREFNAVQFANQLKQLPNYELTEKQFAHLVGRARLYRHIPDHMRQTIPDIMFGDSQINSVCRDYYSDNSFCSNPDGSINLWRLYNLFTGSNKSSYIDAFLDRNVNALQITTVLKEALDKKGECWYLN